MVQLRPTTYETLKECFRESEESFRDQFSKNKRILESTICTLANAKNDGSWPLAMLRMIQPGLALALEHWTAGGFEAIRREQEADLINAGTHAHNMETYFSLLPLWHDTVRHYSKDPLWFRRLESGTIKLNSFMGCSASGSEFAYALPPTVVLEISELKTARLVGALTLDHLEGEVLLPKGAVLKVIKLDKRSKTIYLKEDTSFDISHQIRGR
jgi:hypothetical protein